MALDEFGMTTRTKNIDVMLLLIRKRARMEEQFL